MQQQRPRVVEVEGRLVEVCLALLLGDLRVGVAQEVARRHHAAVLLNQVTERRLLTLKQQLDLDRYKEQVMKEYYNE